MGSRSRGRGREETGSAQKGAPGGTYARHTYFSTRTCFPELGGRTSGLEPGVTVRAASDPPSLRSSLRFCERFKEVRLAGAPRPPRAGRPCGLPGAAPPAPESPSVSAWAAGGPRGPRGLVFAQRHAAASRLPHYLGDTRGPFPQPPCSQRVSPGPQTWPAPLPRSIIRARVSRRRYLRSALPVTWFSCSLTSSPSMFCLNKIAHEHTKTSPVFYGDTGNCILQFS